MNALARVRCFFRNRHVPVRQPLGGFRCRECGEAGADLNEMGFDSGYVSPCRKLYSRTHGEVTRVWTLKPD